MVRGGARLGAGRPAIPEHDKRVSVVISVSKKTREWMRSQSREQGVPMGVILEELIKNFEETCGK